MLQCLEIHMYARKKIGVCDKMDDGSGERVCLMKKRKRLERM